MERLRPHRLDSGSPLENFAPLPSAATLPALLEVIRSPGVLKGDVDALLRGLALPLAEGETPRARADFLLSLIESNDVNDMEGTGGGTVRAAAVRALLDLGYPYALELPPEALDEVLGPPGKTGTQQLPIAGLIATFVGLAAQLFEALPKAFEFMFSEKYQAPLLGLILLGALLGPALSAVLGGWRRIRWLQKLGMVTMAIMGSLWLGPAVAMLFSGNRSVSTSTLLTWLIAGLGLVLGAVLTRRPEWLPEEKRPASQEGPPPEDFPLEAPPPP